MTGGYRNHMECQKINIRNFRETDRPNIVQEYHEFGKPPWNEKVDDEETNNTINRWLRNNAIILIAEDEGGIFHGFGVGFELRYKSDIASRIPEAPPNTLYLADLVVPEEYTHLGIGKLLTTERIKRRAIQIAQNTVPVVVRLSASLPSASKNYEALGMVKVAEMSVLNIKINADGREEEKADLRNLYFGRVKRTDV